MKQENEQRYSQTVYQDRDAEKKKNCNMKRGVLIAAAILAVMGLTALFFPLVVGTGIAYLITGGLLLYGISQIMLFFQESTEARSGWSLTNGIIVMIFSGITLISALLSKTGTLEMIAAVSSFQGAFTASFGVSQIAVAFAERKKISGFGWGMVSGGLSLLLSLFMCFNPIVSWFTITTMWGIYLIAASAVLLVTVREKRETMCA